MIDRKLSNKELTEGLIVNGKEILPPCDQATLSQLRGKRQIPFIKIYGKVYYQVSELVEWVNSKRVATVE